MSALQRALQPARASKQRRQRQRNYKWHGLLRLLLPARGLLPLPAASVRLASAVNVERALFDMRVGLAHDPLPSMDVDDITSRAAQQLSYLLQQYKQCAGPPLPWLIPLAPYK